MKNKTNNENFNISAVNLRIFDYIEKFISNYTNRIHIYNIYKNNILIVILLLSVISLAVIYFNQNGKQTNNYFWFSILFILCLDAYVYIIRSIFNDKIKKLDELEYGNNKMFYNFISFKQNEPNLKQDKSKKEQKIKNNKVADLCIDKIYSKISTYNKIKRQLINYTNKRKKEDIINSKKKKSFTHLYNILKDKITKFT